jgi:hypothetical protein
VAVPIDKDKDLKGKLTLSIVVEGGKIEQLSHKFIQNVDFIYNQ